jgi:hypothetical protein
MDRYKDLRERFIRETNAGLAEGQNKTSAENWAELVAYTQALHAGPKAAQSSKGAAAKQPARVGSTLVLLILVTLAIFQFGTAPLPSTAPEATHDTEQTTDAAPATESDDGTEVAEARSEKGVSNGLVAPLELKAFHPVEAVERGCRRIWRDYRWVTAIIACFAAIKLIIMRQSVGEVVGCGLEVAAFLLEHAVAVVRFMAVGLKRMARELRNTGG